MRGRKKKGTLFAIIIGDKLFLWMAHKKGREIGAHDADVLP